MTGDHRREGTNRRSADERRQARARGVDRFGRPTARTLGVSPRQLRKAHPELDSSTARSLSNTLVRKLRARLSRGCRGDAPAYLLGSPQDEAVSPEGPPQAEPPQAA